MTKSELRAHAQAVGLPDFNLAVAPTLEKGSTGPHVALLHRILRAVVPDVESTYEYDNLVGSTFKTATRTTVKTFQSWNYLLSDGVVGDKTWLALTGLEKFHMVFEPPAGASLTRSNKRRCWAAATATLKGLQSEIQHTPASTYYVDTLGGLLNDDPSEPWANNSKDFARGNNLTVGCGGTSLERLVEIMKLYGRVMLNARNLHDDNTHDFVLYGARGDGADKGTTTAIRDPYPDSNNKGAVMCRSFHWLKQQYKDVTYRVFYSRLGDGKK
jgi:hypothetical protein